MGNTLRDEIIEQVERLEDPQRRQVLDFARQLKTGAGMPGRNLLRFAGSIDRQDLEAMACAIQEGCEKVEPGSTP